MATSHSATVLSAPQEQRWLLSKELAGDGHGGSPSVGPGASPEELGSPQPPLPGGIQHLVAVALVGAKRCSLVRVPELESLVAAAGQAVIPVHWNGRAMR